MSEQQRWTIPICSLCRTPVPQPHINGDWHRTWDRCHYCSGLTEQVVVVPVSKLEELRQELDETSERESQGIEREKGLEGELEELRDALGVVRTELKTMSAAYESNVRAWHAACTKRDQMQLALQKIGVTSEMALKEEDKSA